MIWVWIGFLVVVLILLALDLGVFHRKAHVVRIKEALLWSAFWIFLSLLFNVFVYFGYENHWMGLGLAPDGSVKLDPLDKVPLEGHTAAVKFLTGYTLEKSLSVDNIFVIALVFSFFGIPGKYQHRVLFWGILGALIMRGVMIGLGSVLIARFHWILYVFGAFLIFTAIKMIWSDEDPDPQNNRLVRWARRLFPITHELHGQRFLLKVPISREVPDQARIVPQPATPDVEAINEPLDEDERAEDAEEAAAGSASAGAPDAAPPVSAMGKNEKLEDQEGRELEDVGDAKPDTRGVPSRWMLTPLALALIVVEGTDLIFAVDSIPAIFAITADPFLVFTSNVCAILGLRALYFALAGILDKFHYLKLALALVLGLVGVKMLIADWLKETFPFLKGHVLSFLTLGMIALILGGGVVASLVRARRESLRAESVPTP